MNLKANKTILIVVISVVLGILLSTLFTPTKIEKYDDSAYKEKVEVFRRSSEVLEKKLTILNKRNDSITRYTDSIQKELQKVQREEDSINRLLKNANISKNRKYLEIALDGKVYKDSLYTIISPEQLYKIDSIINRSKSLQSKDSLNTIIINKLKRKCGNLEQQIKLLRIDADNSEMQLLLCKNENKRLLSTIESKDAKIKHEMIKTKSVTIIAVATSIIILLLK